MATTASRPAQERHTEVVGGAPLAARPPVEPPVPVGADQPARSRAGLWLLWSAAVTCPCHFPLIVLVLLGGTALGVFLRAHLVLLFGLSAAYFGAALLAGLWLLRRRRDAGCLGGTCPIRAGALEERAGRAGRGE